jgi:hypothetical protein
VSHRVVGAVPGVPDRVVRTANMPDTVIGTANVPDTVVRTANVPDTVVRTANVPDTVIGTANMPDTVIGTANVPDCVVGTVPAQVIHAVTGDGGAREAGHEDRRGTSTQHARDRRAGSQRLHPVALGPSHRLGPSCLKFVRSLR